MKTKIFGILVALALALGFILVLAAPAGAIGASWYVDGALGTDDGTHGTGPGADAFRTIQYAIDDGRVVSGDTINVAAGTYIQNITLRDGVDVMGAGAGSTTIYGLGIGSAVTATNVSSGTKLDGFTIRNGSTTYGGGMHNLNSSPTVTTCTFTSNSAAYGGGIYNENSSPTVTTCTFSGNSADEGGGMYNVDSSSPTVTTCTFSGNSADYGGGMYNVDSSSPTVTDCDFLSNIVNESGGGMFSNTSSPTVTDCTFSENHADWYGGGMCNHYNSSPTLTGCTFSGNSADYGGGICNTDDGGGVKTEPVINDCTFVTNDAGYGGGIFNTYYVEPQVTNCTFDDNSAVCGGGMENINWSSATVVNCTFSNNDADDDGGGMYNDNSSPTVTNCTFSNNDADDGGGMDNWEDSSPTVTNCIFWGDSGGEIYNEDTSAPAVNYCDIQGGYLGGTGNINTDPLFVNAGAGNFHLQSGSPCIDAGDNTAPSLPATDFEGDPRSLDGDDDGVATVDMGVDESSQVWVDDDWQTGGPPYAEDTDGDADFATITAAIDAVNPGGTVHVAAGTYNENNITIDKSLTLWSVTGDWHDTTVNATGGNGFQFISFDSTATISGLTINSGDYGIYIEGTDADSSVTVSNCHIYEAGFAGIFGGDGLYGDIFIDDCVIGRNGLSVGGTGGIHLDNTVAGTVEITDSVIGAYWDGIGNYLPNTGDGIQIDSIFTTGNVLIDNCKIVNNTVYGISDAIWGCHGHLTITDNIIGAYDYDLTSDNGLFDGNGGNGIFIDYVGGTGVVDIEGNRIAQNGGNGICFDGADTVFGAVIINENTIGAWTDYEVDNDTIYIRKYGGNVGRGIYANNIASGGSMAITDNKIAENGQGIYIASTSGNTNIGTTSNVYSNYVGSWTQNVPGIDPAPDTLFDNPGPWSAETTAGDGTVAYAGNSGVGIVIDNVPAGSLLIQNNNVSKNTGTGMAISNNSGIGEVTIDDNTIDDNGTGGNGIYISQIEYATISGNTITRHIKESEWWTGIGLYNSGGNIISDNTINENLVGIFIDSSSHNNRVINNVISDNAMDGIWIDGDENDILGNTISNNTGAILCGVYLTGSAENNVINFNNITENSLDLPHGVYNSNELTDVDARWNWWGDASGPYHETDNPDGLGDGVSDYVDYGSWLNASVTGFASGSEVGDIDATDETDALAYITGGTADVSIAKYGSNPGSGFSGDTGKYIDVVIQNLSAGVTEIEIRLYYTDAEITGLVESTLSLRWWDGTSWVLCSDSDVDTTDIPGPPPYSGYMCAKIRGAADANPTTPTLEQLTGSVFGGGGVLASSLVWGGDTTAPRISNVLTCYDGVTETTADICWRTTEQSTSQVEYEASPGMLSPLDETYVNEHHVHLTSLTPCTTYNYRTMSMDRAGNLAISDVYTFTTLGEATFTSSVLSISPGEVSAGETVNISVVVTNTCSCLGSYTVTLKINDVVEETSEVTLEAGAGESVTFTVSRDEAGAYSVDIDGLSGSFTVTAPEEAEDASTNGAALDEPPVNWPLIGGIIAGVVIIGLLIFFVVRRKAA
jgi:parallel beta-helix repeat protein/predicted outer membrane repeat protein